MKKINKHLLALNLITVPLILFACLSATASEQPEEIVYGKYEIVSYYKLKGMNNVYVRTWSPSLGILIASKKLSREAIISSVHGGKLEKCVPFPKEAKQKFLRDAPQIKAGLGLMELHYSKPASTRELNSEQLEAVNEVVETSKALVRFVQAVDVDADWYVCEL